MWIRYLDGKRPHDGLAICQENFPYIEFKEGERKIDESKVDISNDDQHKNNGVDISNDDLDKKWPG